MDSKKPGEESEAGKDESPPRSARERADDLSSTGKSEDRGSQAPGGESASDRKAPPPGGPDSDLPAGPDSGSGKTKRPRLTEKQRIEARRRRREQKRRPVSGNVLSRGIRATAIEVRRTLLFLGRALLSGLDSLKPVGGLVVSWLGTALRAVAGAGAAIYGWISVLFAAAGRLVLALDRIITPRRALLTIAMVAAGLLAASQFIDYRAIEIGQPGYLEIAEITGAPRVDVKSPIDTHSVLLLVLSAVALGSTAAAALTGRRRFAAALALAGAGAVLVALAIDLPRGLDASEAELAYSGVKALLLSGFWLELGAGVVLAVTGLSLMAAPAGDPKAAGAPRPDRGPGTRRRAVAGGPA